MDTYHSSEKIEDEAKRLELLAIIANEEAARILSDMRAGGFNPKLVVDFGCGSGDAFPIFRRIFPDARLTGIDQSEKAAALALKRYGVPVHVGDITAPEEILQELGPIGLAYFRNILVHVKDPASVLRQVTEHLTPDGILMVQEPDWTAAEANWDDFAKFKSAFNAMMHKLGLNPFMGKELEHMFQSVGLRNVHVDRSSRTVKTTDASWEILYALLEVGSRWITPYLEEQGIASVEDMRARIESARSDPQHYFKTPAWVIVWGAL